MKPNNTLLFTLISCFFAFSNPGYSQNDSSPCWFDEYTNNQNILETEKLIQAGVGKILESRQLSDTVKTIPVVVHVIHTGGSENISQAQVQSQIDVLNEDCRKITGTNGDGAGVDTRVQFCLANIDPNGNCTNGIVRINSPLANHQTYERPLLKELSFWDNERYLNIYVVKSITGGILGYSSFPGGPPDEDGVVVRHNYFGRTGTASGLGRTTTHELGHWLGVYHTFTNGCGIDTCSDGDFVCDTPPVASANFGCPVSVNSCSNDVPDLPDQIENYMDYTSDGCKDMFTNGQKLRMQSTLSTIRTLIWNDSNLIATGCDTNYVQPVPCPVVADLVTLTPQICVGNSIYFMDRSLNNPTSWQWFFPGGTPDNSTQQNPTVTYDSVGTFAVILMVSDSASTDNIVLNGYITVSLPGTGDPLPYSENFESGIFPPSGIAINNPDGGVTWELDSNASTSGSYSIRINNLINTNYGTIDEIILPYFDLTSIATTPYMKFNWAYAKSVALYSDELILQLSTDCGSTFNQIFYKTGNALATGPTQTTPFIPDSSQWKSALINLSAYASEPYVLIKVINVTDGGNNLYIDDINIGDINLGIQQEIQNLQFSVYPNPATEEAIIQYRLAEPGKVSFGIYDALGKLMNFADEGYKLSGTHLYKLNTASYPAGMYCLKALIGKELVTRKILITL